MPEMALSGNWSPANVFHYELLDADGTGNSFETDQDVDTTPSVKIDTIRDPDNLKKGLLLNVFYCMNPTNAVTYTLRIWRGAIADNMTSYSNLIYESPAAQADTTIYHREIRVPFTLDVEGDIYVSLDWTGAPDNTPGFLILTGEIPK